MFLNETLLQTIRHILESFNSNHKEVKVVDVVSGGSINSCYKLQCRNQYYFLKVNNAEKFPGMFSSESEGLKRIRETKSIKVPETIAFGVDNKEQFLLMKWVQSGGNSRSSQELLGRELAALHRNHNESFGLDHDNYMGSLPQKNALNTDWSIFFIHNRLIPQIGIARQKGFLDNSLINDFQILFKRLDTLFPSEKPSLVHGDLWGGNYMIDSTGDPVLIDPAVAYGHREVDLAMTALFGGFNQSFYDSYNEEYPLEKEWKERIDLWNLYPLLVHVNLFGTSYLNQLVAALRKYL